MKRLVICLTILFSSFLFINKTSAANGTCDSDKLCFSYNVFTQKYKDEFLNTIELENNINELKNYFKNQSDYKYYAIILTNDGFFGRIGILLFNNENPYLILKTNTQNVELVYLEADSKDNKNIFYYKYIRFHDNYYDFKYQTDFTLGNILGLFLKKAKGYDMNSWYMKNENNVFPEFILYDSNIDIKIKNFTIKFLDEDKVLTSNDIFPKYLKAEKPELEFEETPIYSIKNQKLTLTGVNLKINMKNYSDEYHIAYKTVPINATSSEIDSIGWSTFAGDSVTLEIKNNVNVIAKILDNVGNDTGTTYTYKINSFTEIEQPTQDDYKIEFSEYKNLITTDLGEEFISSIDLTIKYKAPYDKNYKLGYSLDNGDNFKFFNNSTISSNINSITLKIEENQNVVAVITDDNGTIIKSASYTINNIDNIPKITFKNISTNNESAILTIDYKYIDYDKYIYQYKDFEDKNWHTKQGNGTSIDISFSENTTIIARVLNKGDNSIFTSASYTVNNIVPKDMFDILDKNNNTNDIFNIFNNVWESLKGNGKIYTYLMIVITTSVIILIIKSIKKN